MKNLIMLGMTIGVLGLTISSANAAKLVKFNNIGVHAGQRPTASQVIPAQLNASQPVNAICKLNQSLASGKILVKGFTKPAAVLAFSPTVSEFKAVVQPGTVISYVVDPKAPLQSNNGKALKLVCTTSKKA